MSTVTCGLGKTEARMRHFFEAVRAQLAVQLVVADDARDLVGHPFDVPEVRTQSVAHDLGDAGVARDYDRGTVAQALERDQAERLAHRWHHAHRCHPERTVDIGPGNAAGEVHPLGQAELNGAVDDLGEQVARPHHYEAHMGHDVRHAAGHLDEILRALLARDPADEQNDRLVIREGLWLRDVGSGARVVQPPRHDVDAGRIDLVRFDHLSAHTEAVADNVVRREQPLPFAAPDLGVLSRPRAVALRGVDVRYERAPRYLVRTSTPRSATARGRDRTRSEEHTSEHQSRLHLVCRPLLYKQKNLLVLNHYL